MKKKKKSILNTPLILGPVYFASLVPIKEDLLENCPSCCVCMVFFFFFPPTITRTVTLIIYSTDCVCVTQNRNVFSTYSKSPVFFLSLFFSFCTWHIAVVYIVSLYQFVIDEMKSHHVFFSSVCSFVVELQNFTTMHNTNFHARARQTVFMPF